MALTLYGSPRSRSMRVLWMLAELGLDYRHEPVEWNDPALKAAPFLALNPAGAIPVIEDDGFALAESLAINLYLAKRHGAPPLYPATLEGEAQAWRWSLWAQGEVEPWIMREPELREAIPEVSRRAVARALSALERALAGRAWLIGPDFTVADLNVAAVLSPSRAERFDLAPLPAARDWLARCYARPAAVETRRRFA